MRANKHLPSFEELFGALDFKQGDDARSVYSPAAYLADLIQLIDDEFLAEENPIYERREDLKSLLLNSENTFSLSPYLDIVNEILENQIPGDTYARLKQAKYPLKLPFNLEHEQIRQSLKYLGITPAQLYQLFADRTALKQDRVAREFLGLSQEDLDILLQPLKGEVLEESFGKKSSWEALKNVQTFLETTDIKGTELRILLYQSLSEPEKDADLAEQFFINFGLNGYARLDEQEEYIIWSDGKEIPEVWFERVNRFLRLAKKISLSFADLDLILRNCCQHQLDTEALKKIAVLLHLHQTYDLPLEVVCAFFSPINHIGFGAKESPSDLFNRIFNVKYISSSPYVISGSTIRPPQYPKEEFRELGFTEELLSDHNKAFRKRIEHALHLTDSGLNAIVEKFTEKESGAHLWSDPSYTLQLLSVLFRLHQLTTSLAISYEELFCLFDLFEHDPSIRTLSNFELLIHYTPAEQSCYKIIAGTKWRRSCG